MKNTKQTIETRSEGDGNIYVYVGIERVVSAPSTNTLIPRPFMVDGRILAPFALVGTAMGFTASSEVFEIGGRNHRFRLTSGNTAIEMSLFGEEITVINLASNTPVRSGRFVDGVTPRIDANRNIFVPIRSMAEVAGFNVELRTAGNDQHAVLTRPVSRFASENIRPTDIEFTSYYDIGSVEW